MAHPRTGYFTPDGVRALGTTTVIGRFKESGGLLWWACQQGQANPQLPVRDALYGERDKAADIGTAAHHLVFRHIHGLEPVDLEKATELDMGDDGKIDLTDEHRQKIQSAFDAYLSWERMTKLKITHQEIQLVSEPYHFGGCPDAIGIIDGVPCLLDWKTSKSVYTDFLIQLAAYGHLCEHGLMVEHDYQKLGIKVEGFHLCKFSKASGDFAHHYYPELDDAWEQFKLLLRAYDIDKKLKARAA